MTKGYKLETLRNVVSELKKETEKFYADLKAGKSVKLVISNGNKKIGRCMNVSIAPILTCGNCKECKYFCYDVKACLQYKNVREARAKNTALIKYSTDEFFQQLWKRMEKKRTNKFLRFHVSGEIMSVEHFSYMVETARRFPDFKIWTYTKMYRIVNDYVSANGGTRNACIPKNLSVMFSEWKGLPLDNPYNFPVFRCIMPDEQKPDCMRCPGNCDECKRLCKGCVAGESAYVDLH